jgi:hypothetical protein
MRRRFRSVPLAAIAALAFVIASCGGQPFPDSAGGPTTTWPADLPQRAGGPTTTRPAALPQRAGGPQTSRPVAVDPATTRDPRASLLASVQRTSALRSARLAMSMKLTGTKYEALTMSGTGGVDFANGESSLSLRGDDNGDPVTLDVRVVGGNVYSRAGSEWDSTSMSDADVDTPNPESYLTYLQAASSDVRADGHETLRGVDTTRYGATLDFGRALSDASGTQRDVLEHVVTVLGGAPTPATVWIDGNGDLRKVQLSFDLTAALHWAGVSLVGFAKLVVGVEFYDFGSPVHVVAPNDDPALTNVAESQALKSDLRVGMTSENVVYVESGAYTDNPIDLTAIDPALDWGGKLHVVVGDASGRHAVVCLSETTAHGSVYSIADVAKGPHAGRYYGRSPCPSIVDDVSMSRLAWRW